MPFDANLVLADTTADWTYASLNTYGTPVLTTRNDGGFAVIDMLALSTTAAKGMACVLVIDEAGAATDDALIVLLQASDNVGFDTDTGPVRTLANFEVGGVGHGIILGNECPCTVVRRFTTRLRYIRVDASCVAGDNFHTCQVMLAPWPFHTL